jgi:pilus assembly protein TadC
VSVALRAGQPLDAALALAADPATAVGAVLLRVAGLLRLGADPDQAWRIAEHDAVLTRVAATARRSATSGTRLAAAFERLAADLREEIRAGAQARAHRVGALAAAPLGLCFLPAFVCLGIVPIIVGIAGGVLGR